MAMTTLGTELFAGTNFSDFRKAGFWRVLIAIFGWESNYIIDYQTHEHEKIQLN